MEKRNSKGQFTKMSGIVDLTGKQFGKLTVVKLDKVIGRKSYWICECECGTIKSVRGDTLKVITSCGCVKRQQDIINLSIENNHNMTHHPLYKIWNAVRSRCENPNNSSYKDYGGRGIQLCDEWHDVCAFISWAENNGWKNGLTIERKDVNDNYCPENCEWIPMKYQVRNRRNTVRFTIDGIEDSLINWAEKFGVPYRKVAERYYRGETQISRLFYQGNLSDFRWS